MVQLVQILMEATRVFVLMDGLEMTAVKILTTVWMLPALTEQRVSMELAISRVAVRREKLDCFAI